MNCTEYFSPTFIATFAATLSGVLLAFILARLWDFYVERRSASKYLQNIRKELLECVSLLEPREGNLLPMDNWDSLVSSGQLKLLKHEIVTELAGVYSRIKNSNYEAQVCRHAVEDILRKEIGNVAIHCHSYQHQKALVDGISEDIKPRLIVHTRKDREQRLREWMQSRGKVFVSVAFSEGQDWKYDICDAQILLKVPFPDIGDMRVRRRLELGYQQCMTIKQCWRSFKPTVAPSGQRTIKQDSTLWTEASQD